MLPVSEQNKFESLAQLHKK